jgi:hypothetical protein
MTAGLLAALLATAAAPQPDARGSPEAGFVAVSPADERPVGRLLRLSADGAAELATATGPVVVRDVISLRRTDVPLPPLPRGPALITTTGDRIPGRLRGGDEKAVQFEPAAPLGELEVPASAVAAVWLTRPPADTPTDPARYPWLADARNRDVLLFRNGDTLRGTLEGFVSNPPAVRVRADGEPRSLPLAGLAAVAFNPAVARTRKPTGPYARLVLRDGTRLDVTGPTADGKTLRGTTLFGRLLEIPLAGLVGLDVYQGKAVYLSDLKPTKAEQAGFLGVPWPWAADRTVRGAPLRLATPLGNQAFDRGLGTHPRTVLTYDLGGKYRRFESLVGLDPVTGRRGRAEVRVLVDGAEQPLPRLKDLASGEAMPVRLDVSGARELTLVIDFGPAGGVQADVNWADARLIE